MPKKNENLILHISETMLQKTNMDSGYLIVYASKEKKMSFKP